MKLPLAIVGAGFRDAPTAVRAKLLALDDGPDSPSRALLEGGHVSGVVRLSTCSRVEFVLSTGNPAWATAMLESALCLRAGGKLKLHVRHGHGAAHYLFRVALGLDSVAEGEAAVGRQVLKSFADAHKAGTADPVLRRVWKEVEALIHQRREAGDGGHGWGVQSLVCERLREAVALDAAIVVWGQGEIGKATLRGLRRAGFTCVVGLRRDQAADLERRARAGAQVVVCTAGPEAWLELPPAGPSQWCIDIGAPAQVKSAPRWQRVDLDELLSGQRQQLDDGARERLDAMAGAALTQLSSALEAPAQTKHLSQLEQTRRRFLTEALPPLLVDLPRAKAEQLKRTFAQFAHQMLIAAREPHV